MQKPNDAADTVKRDVAGAQPAQVVAPGRNCCAVAEARHAAVLIDAESYFAALDASLRRAERSIMIIGWDFDAGIRLRPQDGPDAVALGDLLRTLVDARPELHVRVLVWSLATMHGPSASLPLLAGADWAEHERIHVQLDTHHPVYASHHQKIVIIDGSVAFVGGMDLTVERWDRPGHAPDEALRTRADGERYEPVHDVQMVLDGPVTQEICAIARARWHDATQVSLPVEEPVDRWPADIRPHFRNVRVAVSRTLPRFGSRPAVEEAARLTDDLLRAARRTVYVETQYFTGRRVGRLLEGLLAQPDGPQIVVICTRVANGIVERFIMGANRERLIRRLKAADRHDRLRIYYPVVDGAERHRLLIHSKVMIVDDRFLRIGSANLNNRSVGLDTECDVTVIADTSAERDTVLRLRNTLLAEHLGIETSELEAAVREDGLAGAIDCRLDRGHGLRPMTATRGTKRSFPGTFLLDPERPFPFAGALQELWSRVIGRARFGARESSSSENASAAEPRQRGMRK